MDLKLDLKTLNNLLKNLQSPDNKILRRVERKEISTPITPEMDGYQGEENIYIEVYEIISQPGLFLKIEIYTDSYGDGTFVRGVQFVTPKQKTITIYE